MATGSRSNTGTREFQQRARNPARGHGGQGKAQVKRTRIRARGHNTAAEAGHGTRVPLGRVPRAHAHRQTVKPQP
jgi:hypothetical protein